MKKHLGRWTLVSLFSMSMSFTVIPGRGRVANRQSMLTGSNHDDAPSSSTGTTTTFREDLMEWFRGVQHCGDFCATKIIDVTLRNLPKVQIEGIDGVLTYPIDGKQAWQIRGVASKAPLGIGKETVVDEEYRKTWQLEPHQVKLVGNGDEKWLEEIVSEAAEGLGVHEDARVQAKLHKFLLYEEGSFFKEHRDTQKEPGMFATLAIQLPSVFRGGSMDVKHLNVTKTLHLEEDSDVCLRWTAWYADCYHENRPLEAGNRIALIYNLVRPSSNGGPPLPLLTPWDFGEELETLGGIVQKWQNSLAGDTTNDDDGAGAAAAAENFFESKEELDEHRRLNDVHYVHKLDHAYSVSRLPSTWKQYYDVGPALFLDRFVQVDSWEGLKGRDRTVAGLLGYFGWPLRVRFVVQDIVQDWNDYTNDLPECKTVEIDKTKQRLPPEPDDEQTSVTIIRGDGTNKLPLPVAVSVDVQNEEAFALYRNDEQAAKAIRHQNRYRDTIHYTYEGQTVAHRPEIEMFGNEGGGDGFSEYCVGFLIVELLPQRQEEEQ